MVAGPAPPEVGVKVNVAALPVLPATRSTPATLNVTAVTAPPITPDATDAEAVWSTLVATKTPPPAVGVPPMVKPVTVTVTAVLAATAAPVVTTICVLVGVTTEPVGPLPLICTLGDPALAKKPDGYVSVILLPAASAPPAVVVNENVAAAPVLLATRSALATANKAPLTCPPIAPDATPADAVTSTLVNTEMPALLLPAAAPMVRPSRVIVTAVLAASDVPAVVITIDVAPGALMAVNVAPTLETAPVGVAVAAKKPAGNLSVMLLPAASSPPAVVVNENVAAAPVLPATRSDAAIANEEFVTCPPITPELTLEDPHTSFDVFKLTATEPAVAGPIVKPRIVTVNAADALMVAPDVFSTREVLPVAPHTMFKPGTLLAPASTVGVTEGAKKLGG